MAHMSNRIQPLSASQLTDESENDAFNRIEITPVTGIVRITKLSASIIGGAGDIIVTVGGGLSHRSRVSDADKYTYSFSGNSRGEKGLIVRVGQVASITLYILDTPPPAFDAELNVNTVFEGFTHTTDPEVLDAAFAFNGVSAGLPGEPPRRGTAIG